MKSDKTYVESITHEYALQPYAVSKVKAWERLNKKSKWLTYIFACAFGIAVVLVMGVGMCFSLNVLDKIHGWCRVS